MLSVLEDFAKNPNKYDNSITISGYAGTGKTTMIGIFNKWLKANGIVPVFSSPTHRANAVTRMNNPEANIKTLHSIFGLSPLVDLENGQYDLRKMKSEQVRSPKINPGDFLIIDESSMVSETLYNFIEDFKKQYGIYIIYMGDKAQLSPVKDKDISPVFRNTKSKIELTKVERTGDNPILAESTALREGKDLSYTTHIKNGHGVEYIKTNSERIDQVINDIVSSDEYKNNPLYFRILSATNAKVEEANIRVRKQIYGDNAKQIEVGELLMGYDNISNGDSELIRNSIDYVADEVSEKKINQISVLDGKTLEIEGYEVVLRNAMTGELSEKVFVLDNNISDQKLKQISDTIEYLNRYISDLFNSHMYDQIGFAQRILSNVKKNTILMKNVTSGKALKIRKTLDYGYSHTVHKSQGGTYNKIMFYADTVNVFDEKVAQQLKYVAVSRAKEDVYIVTSNNINESVIENQDMQTEQIDKNTLYYNEDGTLKDIPLTQTVKKQIEESSKTGIKSTDVLRNKNGEPITLYRGYAMTEDREAVDIDETVAGTASDYAEGIDAKYHFTTSREEAEDYSKIRTDKSAEPTAEGKINRHYTGDFAKVSTYHISANAKVAVFDDLRDFDRNKDSEKVKNADVIALRKGTLYGAPEYIVKSSAKSLIIKANTQQSEPINIWFSSNENAELSNMAIRSFTIQYSNRTVTYQSVEHFFQASKALLAKDKDMFNAIIKAKTGAEAKRLGNQVKGLDSKAWDNKSSEIMKRGILESFKQNPEAAAKLLATGNAELTHTQDKGKWGKEFPKILMEVRDEIK